MFDIFLYEGNPAMGEAGEEIVKSAVQEYCSRRGISLKAKSLEILREEKGKPFFPHIPVHFNISHSRDMWVCIMGPSACGIDIQEVKECDYKKIASKFCTRTEQGYIMKKGLEGFFDIWVRREAYGKYLGKGFFLDEDRPSFADEEGKPVYEISSNHGKVYLREIDFSREIKCVYCTEGEDDEIQIFG